MYWISKATVETHLELLKLVQVIKKRNVSQAHPRRVRKQFFRLLKHPLWWFDGKLNISSVKWAKIFSAIDNFNEGGKLWWKYFIWQSEALNMSWGKRSLRLIFSPAKWQMMEKNSSAHQTMTLHGIYGAYMMRSDDTWSSFFISPRWIIFHRSSFIARAFSWHFVSFRWQQPAFNCRVSNSALALDVATRRVDCIRCYYFICRPPTISMGCPFVPVRCAIYESEKNRQGELTFITLW